MAIVLSNGVTNINGTPGINSDVFANRPAATDVALGSIYIATDTGVIYQSNGATWSTIGGGGGPTPTPGIDDVLSVNQPLSVPQVIEMAGNTLSFQDGFLNAFQFFPDGDFQFGKNVDLRFDFTISPGSNSLSLIETTGTNHLSIQASLKNYFFGDFNVRGNGNSLQILDTSDTIDFFNKGIINGISLNFNSKLFKFGRLNTGSEQSLEVDELNDITSAKFNGITNGLNLDYSAKVFQFGYLDTIGSDDVFLSFNGNGSTIAANFNGNDNGLNINFNSGSRLFQFGDYQGNFNSTKINLDDNGTSILISSNQTTGSTTIEGNSLVFTGANLESGTASGNSGQHLVITLNGVVYHIKLENP
jgi:hypothetical protein